VNTFTRILKLIGIHVKVSVPGGSCPHCGARPPAHSEAWRKGQLVRLPKGYNDEWTQRR
jgi:hypothetical protein